MIFTDFALWAGLVIELPCLYVHVSVIKESGFFFNFKSRITSKLNDQFKSYNNFKNFFLFMIN